MATNVFWKDRSDVKWKDRADVKWRSAEATTINFMRSMRMGIEYESILEDVTPDDSNDLTSMGILYIGTGGDVKVTGVKSGTVTLKNVPSGTWLNFIRVIKVFTTGTTATDIVLAR